MENTFDFPNHLLAAPLQHFLTRLIGFVILLTIKADKALTQTTLALAETKKFLGEISLCCPDFLRVTPKQTFSTWIPRAHLPPNHHTPILNLDVH